MSHRCSCGHRSEPEFLYRVLAAVIEAGATTVNIPDTTGWALPHEFVVDAAGCCWRTKYLPYPDRLAVESMVRYEFQNKHINNMARCKAKCKSVRESHARWALPHEFGALSRNVYQYCFALKQLQT